VTIEVRPPREQAPSWWPDPYPPARPPRNTRPRSKAHPRRRTWLFQHESGERPGKL